MARDVVVYSSARNNLRDDNPPVAASGILARFDSGLAIHQSEQRRLKVEMLLVKKYREETETLRTQLAKSNKRVAELELVIVAITHADETGYVDDVGFVEGWSDVCDETKALLNKLAIEKKIEGVNQFCATLSTWEDVHPIGANYVTSLSAHRDSFNEQLRKEQPHD